LNPNEQLLLASYLIDELIKEDKTVRDPVHGDILWNHLETSVIDTEIFQRLRRIKQLGTVHFVYPGAEHSRFQHSLGTLHMAKILLQCIRNNRFSEYRSFGNHAQDSAFELVVRLAALIHDVHEFPLSHTLEKEGNIFPPQWKVRTFNKRILGEGSEIFKAISDNILKILGPEESARALAGQPVLNAKDKEEFSKLLTKTIITFAYKVVKGRKFALSGITNELFGDEDIITNLIDKKFLVAANQIVLDTVCADLLDYLPRDFCFCGIKKTYDERFLKYASISTYIDGTKKKQYPVFAYNLVGKRKELKQSVLSSLFDALELRYTLAELIHTHRTKNAFSAMAIEAFNFYYQSLDEDARQKLAAEMMHMGDDDMLSYVRRQNPGSEQNLASEHILDHYFKRRPYQECILCRYKTVEDEPDIKKALKEHLYNPRERLFLEKLLVKWLNYDLPSARLREGDFLIYLMPLPGRLFKELKTNVKYLDQEGKDKVGTLLSLTTAEKDYSSMSRTMRIIMERTILQRQLLIKKFKNLWHASLFISPDVDHETVQPIAVALIEKFFSCARSKIQFEAETPKAPTLSNELNDRVLKIVQDKKRSFATFEDIFNNS
jgi:HD superfamily phosphohydrolase